MHPADYQENWQVGQVDLVAWVVPTECSEDHLVELGVHDGNEGMAHIDNVHVGRMQGYEEMILEETDPGLPRQGEWSEVVPHVEWSGMTGG